MKKTRIRPISKKREVQLQEELVIRKQLCERAGGIFIADAEGKHHYCLGGHCESCNSEPDFRGLHPHEKKFRSHGGKLSLENSLMLCGKCHSARHGVTEVD